MATRIFMACYTVLVYGVNGLSFPISEGGGTGTPVKGRCYGAAKTSCFLTACEDCVSGSMHLNCCRFLFLSHKSMAGSQLLFCTVVGAKLISIRLSQNTALTKLCHNKPIFTTALAITSWLQPKAQEESLNGIWCSSSGLRSQTQTIDQNISSWNKEFHETNVLCQKLNGGGIFMGNLFSKNL